MATAGNSINVPRNPANIGAAKNTLSMVVPMLSKHRKPVEQLMNSSECDSVSQRIVGGKQMVIGYSQTGTKRLEDVSVRGNEISHVAKAVTMQRAGDNTNDFAQHYTDAKQNKLNLFDDNRAIKPEVTNYFSKGFFRRGHLIPTDRILRALSAPSVSHDIWKQVYELHVGKTEEKRPDDYPVISHIEKILNV